MLALVIVIGVESGGAKRWLGYGELSFQPSEMMKIALVLALARYYQWLPPKQVSWPHAVLPPLLMIGAPALLALDQPDLGTAALFGIVGGGLLFLAGVSWIYFVAAFVGVIVVLPHVWERLHDYQKERILTFIDPDRDPLGSGYHILQSKIAIGSGGFTGKGYHAGHAEPSSISCPRSTPTSSSRCSPRRWASSARPSCLRSTFSCCCSSPIWRSDAAAPSPRLVAAGMGLCLFAYVFINVAMVTGLVPVVGVPLPLVSYGGTSMLTMMVGLGFVLNAHVNRETRIRREELGPFW